MDIKQVILVNTSLGMRKGKTASQVAHAAVKAAVKSNSVIYSIWDEAGHKKVVLAVDNPDIFFVLNAKLIMLFDNEGIDVPSAIIKDQGLTQIPPDSWTAMAIGPYYSDVIDRFTGELPLLN